MHRRAFLATTSATLTTVGLAGCMGGDGVIDTEGGGAGGGATTEQTGETTTEQTSETTDEGGGSDVDIGSIDGTLGDEVSENVEVSEHRAFETEDDVGVTGVIENSSGEPLEFIEVEVTLNDGDTLIGEFIDTSEEELDYLAPNKQWRFWVTFDDESLTPETTYTINVEAEISDDIGDGADSGTTTQTETTIGN